MGGWFGSCGDDHIARLWLEHKEKKKTKKGAEERHFGSSAERDVQNSVAYVPFCYFEQHTLSLWTEVSSWRPSLMWPLCEKLLLTTRELLAVGDGGETLARVVRLAEKQTKLLGAQAVIFQTRRRKKKLK